MMMNYNKIYRALRARNKKCVYSLRLTVFGMLFAACCFPFSAAAQVQVGGNVFGGGNKAPVGRGTTVVIDQSGAAITGSVYGGGALAEVDTLRKVANPAAVTADDSIVVKIMQGTIYENVYGGGLGDSIAYGGTQNVAAHVYGPIHVYIGAMLKEVNDPTADSLAGSATIRGEVFGCNNLNGSPKSDVLVDIWQTAHNGTNIYPDPEPATVNDLATPAADNCFAISAVYGGGNKAAYAPLTAASNTDLAKVHIHTCLNTIKTVYGGGNAADATTVQLVIEGGRFDRIFGGGNGAGEDNPGADISVSATTEIHGGLYRQVFGGSNQKGDIASASLSIDKTSGCTELIYEAFGGANEAPITGSLTTSLLCGDVNIGTFYGGSNLANIDGDVTLYVRGGTYNNIFGGSKGVAGTAANIGGDVTLNLYGGTMTNAFGGSDVNGNIDGSITVNVNDAENVSCPLVVHNVYGGGRDAAYTPTTPGAYPEVNLINGTVSKVLGAEGNVFGGGLGSTAEVTSNPVVNLQGGTVQGTIFGGGSAAPVTGNPTVNAYYGSAPTIHGGGWGSTADVTGDPTVVVNETADKTLTVTSVYGGGDAAEVEGNTIVTLTEGAITNAFGGGNVADITGTTSITLQGANVTNIYGGGNAADVSSTATISMTSGNVSGGLYGGCNASGSVDGAITVTLTGGTVGAAAVGSPGDPGYVAMQRAYVHGGGYGQSTSTGSDVSVTVNGTNVYGEVYGGSALGSVNASSSDATTVTLTSGTVYGAVYGGGLGRLDDPATGGVDEAIAAPVNGAVTVLVNGGVADSIFGCNNLNGAPQDTVIVNVTSGNANYIFGGGNVANYTRTPDVNISGGTVYKVFGGGNEANVGGGDVSLTGGTVANGLYGGCNTSGTVTGNIAVSLTGGTVGVDGTTTDVVYGGGFGHSTATNGNVTVTLGGSTVYGNLYGGSALGSVNAAGKTTTVNINDDDLNGSVFGGGMGSGTGSSTQATTLGNVVVNYNTANSAITGIYGGANINGDVSGNIAVNIEANVGSSSVGDSLDIFGGGKGHYTSTGGNVTVTVGNSTTPTIYGDIYGGSEEGEVGATGKIAKVDFKAGTLSGTIFGGGKGQSTPSAITAEVSGGTEVAVATGSSISGGIYGGANINGTVAEDITVNVNGGTIGANGSPASVFGGGYGNNTSTQGDITVNIGSTLSVLNSPIIWGDVYGGSGFGNVNNTAADSTTVNILNGEVKGNIFGGGLGDTTSLGVGHYNYAAKEYGVVTVNIGKVNPDYDSGNPLSEPYLGNATIGGNVYGCNNTYGSPQDTVVVNIYKTAHTTTPTDNTYSGTAYAIRNVFGGGKKADYTASKRATVNVYTCDNTIDTLYGGGDAAAVTGSKVVINGGRFNYVFGGGNGAGAGNPGADIGSLGITLDLHGGTIGTLVSASNEKGDIDGSIKVNVDHSSSCDEEVTDFFGGANMVDIATDVTTTIGCGAGTFRNVYGGSNKADIGGNVTLNIQGGTIGRVFGGSKGTAGKAANITGNVLLNLQGGTIGCAFGGSNINGTISGTITVNVEDQGGLCPLAIDSVFGAGNLTAYTGNPAVNIKHGTVGNLVDGVVFGGGKGLTAVVTGTPAVTIGDNNAAHRAIVTGSVFGGGDAAAVTGSTTVTYNDNNALSSYVGNIYGGGNAAGVSDNTQVTLTRGRVTDGIFGGCNTSGTVGGNATVELFGGQVGTSSKSAVVFGGGYGSATNIAGDVLVTMGKIDNSGNPTLYADIYGGSALGNVNTSSVDGITKVNSTNTTTLDILSGILDGNIYGGGLGQRTPSAIAPLVHGMVQINIGRKTGTNEPPEYTGYANLQNADIYGCNNVNGSPQNDVHIDVYATAHPPQTLITDTTSHRSYAIADLYGGGNAADYAPENGSASSEKKTYIHVYGCDNTIGELFGGGNAAAVVGDSVIIEGGRFNEIFGGGNGAVAAANVGLGGIHLNALSGRVGYIFEQCNKRGEVTHGAPIIYKHGGGECNNGILQVDYHFCGGNIQDVYGDSVYVFTCSDKVRYMGLYGGCRLGRHYGNIKLVIEGGFIGEVYGGSMGMEGYSADVRQYPDTNDVKGHELDYPEGILDYLRDHPTLQNTGGNVVVEIKGGNIGSVFGGCNVNGNVEGRITVIIDSTESDACPLNLDYVYGGGNVARYIPDTVVSYNYPLIQLKKGHVNYDVFGGGHGSETDVDAGIVYSNPHIVMAPADGKFWVKGNIYGGGEMGSVGKYTRDASGKPTACDANTGHTTIEISAGKVGPAILQMPDYKGHVFGGSKGAVGDTTAVTGNPKLSHIAYVNTSDVTISGTAFIKGSVYGGGESGRVFDSTYVKIRGGQIGCGWNASTDTDLDRVYTAAEWAYDVTSDNTKFLYECSHWPFGDPSTHKYDPYDPYEHTSAHDGHTFYGNVFGGGSGMMPYQSRNVADNADSSIYIQTAGRVMGNTRVEVTGGHILTSLYGGCELGDVLDTCTVIFHGGTLGVPRTLAQIEAHPVTCYLFGAGKGDERMRFNSRTNVKEVRVTVDGGRIYGSVFGGGEDGHVMRDVLMEIKPNANIGTWGTSYVDGNVFGGGRGFSGNALTAGNVGGDITVNITGGTMLGSIYGGGRLASVGYGLYPDTDPRYGVMRPDNEDDAGIHVDNFSRGHITVNISGSTVIGKDIAGDVTGAEHSGNVFGGSMGRLKKLDGSYLLDLWQRLGCAKQTEVNISSDVVVKGNVYGGSEMGSVTENTTVNISGNTVVGRIVNGTLYEGDVYGGGYGSPSIDAISRVTLRDSVQRFSGRTYGNTTINLTDGTVYANVYGGGEMASVGNESNASKGNTTVNIGATDGALPPTYSGDAIIGGNVYGANNTSGTPLGNTNVNIYSTHRTTKQEASYSSADKAYAIANVFGGGHNADYSPLLDADEGTTSTKRATVHVYGCENTIEDIFSGGDAAAAYGVAAIIDGGRFHRVFGGGNGEVSTADIGAGGTNLVINGGLIDTVFGGGNESGTIYGPLRTIVDHSSSCNMNIGGFFGGSNKVPITGNLTTTIACSESVNINEIYGGSNMTSITGNVTLNLYGGTYEYVFGGSKGALGEGTYGNPGYVAPVAADINGKVTLNLYGGDINTAFGGCNFNGVVTDTITINVDSNQAVACGLDIDYIFGGGRLALVTATTPTITCPIVNLINGHVNHEVYGGGLGVIDDDNAGKVTANPQVNMTGANFHVKGSIYGGGSIAVTDGNTEVNVTAGTVGVEGSATTNGNVYGAGLGDATKISAGLVKGNSTVNIAGGRVWHNVYGGGSLASVGTFTYGAVDKSTKSQQITSCAPGTGLATVYISGGIIGNDGHENGMVYGSSRGDIDTILARQDTMAWAYATKVTIGDTTAAHNMTSPQIKGSVYGGGENGHVKQNAYVHIYSGQVGYQGDRADDNTKNIDKSDPTYEFRGNVYGAGCGTDKFFIKDSIAQLVIHGNLNHLQKDGGYHAPHADTLPSDSIFKVYDYNMYAGVVQGNAHIKISGGHIFHNVYGGGAMANVGTISALTQNKDEENGFALSWPNVFTFVEPTGYAHIDITGGRIGTMGSYDGDVFGGARGEAGDRYTMARYGNVRTAVITINYPATATPAQALDTFDVHECITGSVYGGAENGHINDSTFITLTNGLVGHALYGGGKGKGVYLSHGLRYQKDNIDGIHLEGDDSIASIYSLTAGKVYGNTRVVMNGGHVVRNIFGGGNQGSVGKGNYAGGLGDYSPIGYGEKVSSDSNYWWSAFRSSGTTTVIVTDGTVGMPSGTKDDLPLGNIFGGARGTAAPNVNPNLHPRILYFPTFFSGYINRSVVVIGDGTHTPRIYGSVYGGGMDGHTRWGSNVTVKSGEIGNAYTSENIALAGTADLNSVEWLLRGNVYGSGSGIGTYEDASGNDQHSSSAGSVTHFTTVNIEGGTIHRSVYGGGSLATVGPPLIRRTTYAPIDTTLAYVNITGGTIGSLADAPQGYGGNVFGGSRGQDDVDNATFSTVIWSRVDVSNTSDAIKPRIYGSVFGGGEIGTIIHDAAVNISGGIIGDTTYYNDSVAFYNDEDHDPFPTFLGHVYGGGKGIVDESDNMQYKTFNNVDSTTVTVSGGRIYGSIFGGSANGHVKGNTNVTVSGNPVVGTKGVSSWDGHVFGGGEGSGHEVYVDANGNGIDEANEYDHYVLHTHCGRVEGNNKVTISGGYFYGTIYGGGRLALTGVDEDGDYATFVNGSGNYDSIHHGQTTVTISGSPVIGSNNADTLLASDFSVGDVFGSGRGDIDYYESVPAGRVANAHITVTGSPLIHGAIFGGGEMAGVGYWSDNDGHPFAGNTGTSDVSVSGGTVGTALEYSKAYLDAHIDDTTDWTLMVDGKVNHACTGNIVGGSQGDIDITCPAWISMGRSRQTYVNISGDVHIMGNVYGGAEQGVVTENTHVNVSGTPTIGTTIQTTTSVAPNGYYRYGSVFGGGYGTEKFWNHENDSCLYDGTGDLKAYTSGTMIAGRVYGNTNVTITGGNIYENVYGGGNMASVGYVDRYYHPTGDSLVVEYLHDSTKWHNGLCNVTIGGTAVIGSAGLDGTELCGDVYGAGKGVGNDPDGHFNIYSNVNRTGLTVNGGFIYGSTFGGGADCHVLGHARTLIEAGANIGSGQIVNTPRGYDGYEEEYDGCVIGGGRNAKNINHTGGRVQGNTYIKVTGGRIKRSVIGGGALARTGVDVNGLIDSLMVVGGYDSTHHGSTFINVSGDSLVMSQSAFENNTYVNGKTYEEFFKGTTGTDGSGNVIVYLTAIGAPNGSILVDNDYTIGDIFGGGKGDTKDTTDIMAGRVMNTYVKVHKYPRIMADIYAGAEMASVGWWDTNRYVGTYGSSALNPNHDVYYTNTGYTQLLINDNPNDGTPYEFSTENYIVNKKAWTIVDSLGRLNHTCSGNVYGGGQGYVEEKATHRENWVHMGRVRNTQVTINGGRFMGNVFGGGSRGVVKEGCTVTINGGRIGCIIEDDSKEEDGTTPKYHDGRYYYGSVFGGGYGNPKTFSHINDSSFVTKSGKKIKMIPTEQAGRVYGNTHVYINGGHIMDCVYGGGDLASTGYVKRDSVTGNYKYDDPDSRSGGICYVEITDGEIGPLDYNGHNAYVYGGGKGEGWDPSEIYRLCSNVNETHVTVKGGKIWGSTFGGGPDAHVLGDVNTYITTGADLGTDGMTSYDGNIFGGGRNYLNTNHTNGRVQGNIYILMDGGSIKGTIFGGGRLALSGVDSVGHFIDSTHGNVTILVRGNAIIGTPNATNLLTSDESCGDIFGSGKGDIKNYEDIWAGRVTNAKITVKDSTTGSPRIYGAIFGGGEMASLGYWDDTIKNGDDIIFYTTSDEGTNYGVIYENTGRAVIDISGNVLVGTSLEYTVAPYANPGDWTIYESTADDTTLVHTCTGNVFGGSQGDVDPSAPRWVSMGRSASAVVNISGGTFMGNVYGGAEQGIVTGDTRLSITGGTFGIGGIDTIHVNPHVDSYYSGDIYAAGYGCDDPNDDLSGYNDSTNHRAEGLSALPDDLAGRTYGDVRVDITGGTIHGNIYGGGSFASVGYENSTTRGNTNVYIGTDATTGNATILGDVFGANNFSGTPYGNARVDIWKTARTAEQEAETGSEYAIANVFGGGNLADYSTPNKKATVYIHTCDNTVKNVYGGGNAAAVPACAVYIDGGRFDTVFGGGNGTVTAANIGYLTHPTTPNTTPGEAIAGDGNASTTIYGGKIHDLFAGSNSHGFTRRDANVAIDTAGGKECPMEIDNVYGGGNNAHGGGGNIVIRCGAKFGNFYGGANNADIGSLAEWNAIPRVKHDITLTILGGEFDTVFGGNNAGGTVYGDITLNIYGGSIKSAFGGNNKGGAVMGTITVNVDHNHEDACADALRLDTVYGGGKDAAYTPVDILPAEDEFGNSKPKASPCVNIIHDTITSAVFGGGLGNTATVTSNPKVVIGASTANARKKNIGRHVHILNDVYGGGKSAKVIGNTEVLVLSSAYDDPDADDDERDNRTNIDGSIYGGGLGATATIDLRKRKDSMTSSELIEMKGDTVTAAGYHRGWQRTGNTKVDIRGNRTTLGVDDGDKVTGGNVYGGGNAGIVYGNTDIVIGDYSAQVETPFFNFNYEWDDSEDEYVHTVTIGTTTNNASIYYEYSAPGYGEPDDPDDGSDEFNGTPVSVEVGSAIKAIAYRDGYTTSEIAYTEEYQPVSPTPEISFSRSGADVEATLTTPGIEASDKIYYCIGCVTLGTDNRIEYNPAAKPTITEGQIIKAYSLAENSGDWEYSEVAVDTCHIVATPEVDIDEEGNVSISCATDEATIYYTYGTTPATPTESDDEWNGWLTVTNGQTVKAVAFLDGFVESAVGSDVFSADIPAPVITFERVDNSTVEANITCERGGVTIYYTTDGSTPTDASSVYNADSRPAVTNGQTVKAFAAKSGRNNSPVASATMNTPATPTIDITVAGMVTMACATDGVTIRYTTDGATPGPSNTAYSSSFQADNFAVVKAVAFKDGNVPSGTASQQFVPTLSAPVITFTDDDHGGYNLNITCTEDPYHIYYTYTTDGSEPAEPTESSHHFLTPASAPTMHSGYRVKARAFNPVTDPDWNPSPITSATCP